MKKRIRASNEIRNEEHLCGITGIPRKATASVREFLFCLLSYWFCLLESFDLSEESKMAHRTVDDILLLKRENWQLRDSGRRQHKDLLEASGADVIWTDREVAVGVPVTTELEGASAWVLQHLQNTDVKLIWEEKSEWHGMEAWRLDLGIAVKSGIDRERYFTTDVVFFFHHGNLTNRDRDIPKRTKKE